jgi:L-threonylcarbamoyladenylate synthase
VPLTEEQLKSAARILREGGLVAFPTETVYGLGADATNPAAIRRIFEVKGRPSTSPLIVHVSSIEMARTVVAEWPNTAQALATRFWPGPLTLVLKKRSQIPDEVTATLPTVGVRMPAHPVTSALIDLAGIPVAAPSANRFMHVSPTTAEHVRRDLGDTVDMILDGGPTTVGIESTVLSLACGAAVLLRPGMVGATEIQALTGELGFVCSAEPEIAHPAPGLHRRHYAPQTPFFLLQPGDPPPPGRGRLLSLPGHTDQFAAILYAALREADAEGWEWLAITAPPDTPEWAAIHDRLRRAATAAD